MDAKEKTMKKDAQKKAWDTSYEKKTVPVSCVDTATEMDTWEKKDLKARASKFLLDGIPEFSVNLTAEGRYRLLSDERDFHAARITGAVQISARVYTMTEKNAEAFAIVESLKTGEGTALEDGYAMERLVKEYGFTQDDVATLIGRSRPAVANTLRLLTLAPEVVGLMESGQLSAGHARTLVKVPKSQQFAFAEEGIKRGYTVRDMEKAVKAFLTPPDEERQEKEAKARAKTAELKAFVERMRAVFRTKVSLIGNDKKGRIYIEYYSPEDLYRIEECIDMIENYD